MSSTAIAEKVLITGASGYIAAHIVNQLFAQGYNIVGTVRSAAKGDWIAKRYPGFKYEIVKDLTDDDAIVEVFKKHPDIKRVLHTASPVSIPGTDYIKGIVEPAISGTNSVLKAAHKFGKNVEKVVVTSSLIVAFPKDKDFKDPSVLIDETTWNATDLEDAKAGWIPAYTASKIYAEKAVWEFKETVKPKFSVATILVPVVYGPPIHQATYSNIGSSVQFFKANLDLPIETKDIVGFNGHADVRDVARFHILAATRDNFDNQRWLPIGGFAHDQVALDVLHKFRPEETAGVTKGTPGSFKAEDFYRYNNTKTLKNIDFEFIPFTKSILDEFDALQLLKAQEESSSK